MMRHNHPAKATHTRCYKFLHNGDTSLLTWDRSPQKGMHVAPRLEIYVKLTKFGAIYSASHRPIHKIVVSLHDKSVKYVNLFY